MRAYRLGALAVLFEWCAALEWIEGRIEQPATRWGGHAWRLVEEVYGEAEESNA